MKTKQISIVERAYKKIILHYFVFSITTLRYLKVKWIIFKCKKKFLVYSVFNDSLSTQKSSNFRQKWKLEFVDSLISLPYSTL